MTRVKILKGNNLKTGDTEPDLKVRLIKDNDNPKDLSSSNNIKFHMTEVNNSTLIVDDDTNGNVSKSNATNGEVTYSWQSGDTDTAATFRGEFVVVDSNSEQSTYPNDGFFHIYVNEGLA